MAKLVSQVYAEALFGLGVENGLLDTLLEELNGMCEILGKNPQFVTLLGHPELDQKEKTAVFDRVFDGKISKELNGFCHLLLEKGRFGELFAIREDYERRCLARTCLGLADHVEALCLDGDRLGLDRGGSLKAHVCHCAQNALI